MSAQIKVNAKEHPIVGVTVYQKDRAVVQRRFSLELQAGQNDVVIGRLPLVLESDSIRVEAETTSKTQLLTVFDVVHVPPSYSSSVSYDKGTELARLNEQKAAVEASVMTIDGQKSILEGFSDSVKSGRIKDLTNEKLEEFMDLFATRERNMYREKVQLREEIDYVDTRIKNMQGKISSEEGEKRENGVTVILLAKENGPVNLILSYVVRQASWSSLYDIRADITAISGTSKAGACVNLNYRANITQSTGEDWKDVSLTLSTASPLLGSAVPQVQPWRISVSVPRPPPVYRFSASLAPGATGAAPAPAPMQMRRARKMSSIALDEESLFDQGPSIQVRESAISSTFTIEGLSTIPSDNSSHKVSITAIDLSADLEWITVPRSIPSTFLQCRIKNTSSYQLIGGPSSVFMDGSFVAKSTVPNVSPQETFSCSLGVDTSVRVTYHPQNKLSSTTGGGLMSSGKANVTTFKQRISVKNTRATSIGRLIVQDRVPVSEDARIKVSVLQPPEAALGPVSGPSSDSSKAVSSLVGGSSSKGTPGQTMYANVDKNVFARWAQKDEEGEGSGGARGDGVIEWIATDLRETLDLNLAYEISAPVDVRWTDA